jgi:pimeloyl-ACP methyl ester carboxylesterase
MRERPVKQTPGLMGGIGAAAGLVLALGGSWFLYSRYGVPHQVPLSPAVDAPRKQYFSQHAGQISYYVAPAASGRPLVLLHSVNAAASAYEMAPFLEEYQGKRPVYALDLPGFGFSDRSRRIYSPRLYQEVISEFLASVVGAPADVIALSLSGEFAACAALDHPRLFHSLALITPTGLKADIQVNPPQQTRSWGLGNLIHPLLSTRLWALPLFDLIATRSSIEYFLSKSFTGHIPPGMVEYAYASAHQPGAENAPLYFLSGKLFTPNVRARVYERLKVPTLAIYDQDAYSRFDALPDLLLRNSHWQAVRLVPSKGLPHWERRQDTVEVLTGFWKALS